MSPMKSNVKKLIRCTMSTAFSSLRYSSFSLSTSCAARFTITLSYSAMLSWLTLRFQSRHRLSWSSPVMASRVGISPRVIVYTLSKYVAISMLGPRETRHQVLTFSLQYSPSPEHIHHCFDIHNG